MWLWLGAWNRGRLEVILSSAASCSVFQKGELPLGVLGHREWQGMGKAPQPSVSRVFHLDRYSDGERESPTWRFIMSSQNGNLFVQERISMELK